MRGQRTSLPPIHPSPSCFYLQVSLETIRGRRIAAALVAPAATRPISPCRICLPHPAPSQPNPFAPILTSQGAVGERSVAADAVRIRPPGPRDFYEAGVERAL